MDFKTAMNTCLRLKYMEFSGRASRSEYWYYSLGYVIGSIVVSIVGGLLGNIPHMVLMGLYSLGLLLPALAVSVRRLHDLDKSGWWLLISLIPLLGALALLFFYVQKGTTGPNRYGSDPLAAEAIPR